MAEEVVACLHRPPHKTCFLILKTINFLCMKFENRSNLETNIFQAFYNVMHISTIGFGFNALRLRRTVDDITIITCMLSGAPNLNTPSKSKTEFNSVTALADKYCNFNNDILKLS